MNQEGSTEKKSTGKMGTKKTAKKAAYPPDDQASQGSEEYGSTEKKAAGYGSGSAPDGAGAKKAATYPGDDFGGTEKKAVGSPGYSSGDSGGSTKKAAYSGDDYGSTEKKSVGGGAATEKKHAGTESPSGSSGGTTEKKSTGNAKPSQSEETEIRHTVQEGETLGSIADQYMLPSWKYLYEINKKLIGDNPDLLPPGTELKIPSWDSTSGDEKIEEKGARPFDYTGGLRYRDVWVPFKAIISDSDGNTKLFEEKTAVKITDRDFRHTFVEFETTDTGDIQMLLPDSAEVNVGIRGFPFYEGEIRHVHPDDAREEENPAGEMNAPDTSRKTEQELLDDILGSDT